MKITSLLGTLALSLACSPPPPRRKVRRRFQPYDTISYQPSSTPNWGSGRSTPRRYGNRIPAALQGTVVANNMLANKAQVAT